MIHRRALVLAILALGCATPNKYQPGPDGGDVGPTDGMPSLLDTSATVSSDATAATGSADVAGHSVEVLPDVPSTTDSSADVGGQAPRDAPIDTPADVTAAADLPPQLANGEKCASSSGCRSGNCIDEICCAQPCGVCQQCAGPNGSCQSIPTDQPDEFPSGSCSGTRYCDGQSPPRCVDCAKCSNGSCIRHSWTFDSGTLEGATVDNQGVYTKFPAVAVAPAYLGKQSLAMMIPVEFTLPGDSLYARFQVCMGASTANLRTRTFRARVFLETANQATTMQFWLQLYSDQQVAAIADTSYPAGSWIGLEGQLPAVEDGNVKDLILSVGSANNPKWSGRVWVDDVRID
jgi:hypothetical protein